MSARSGVAVQLQVRLRTCADAHTLIALTSMLRNPLTVNPKPCRVSGRMRVYAHAFYFCTCITRACWLRAHALTKCACACAYPPPGGDRVYKPRVSVSASVVIVAASASIVDPYCNWSVPVHSPAPTTLSMPSIAPCVRMRGRRRRRRKVCSKLTQ